MKFIGYKFEDILFELKCLLFQNQMDVKMQNEEDDFNAMLNFENSDMLREDTLQKMIEKTEITESSYHFQY